MLAHFKLDSVCQPGNTLLWDLLQDDKIGQLSEGLATEAEKSLSHLLCFNMERFIRMKFIEGCLNNVASNQAVVISLRLLPKLFNSFQHSFHGHHHQRVSSPGRLLNQLLRTVCDMKTASYRKNDTTFTP